jgi:TetR/AcrR family transcriptional regulator of autoinduction and epiphytic fitness
LTDRKRAAILDAAVEEFATSGFDTTSMDRIAERAGVSKRTVYNHFQSKDALFEAIVQELIAQTEGLPEFPYEADRDLGEQLVGYCLKVGELITSESFQGLVRVSLSRFLRTPQLARDTIGDEKRFMTRLIRWIEQATADGRLGGRLHALASHLRARAEPGAGRAPANHHVLRFHVPRPLPALSRGRIRDDGGPCSRTGLNVT